MLFPTTAVTRPFAIYFSPLVEMRACLLDARRSIALSVAALHY